MFFDILKFYKLCDKISDIDQNITLDEFLKKKKLVKKFYKLSYYTDGFSDLVYATL